MNRKPGRHRSHEEISAEESLSSMRAIVRKSSDAGRRSVAEQQAAESAAALGYHAGMPKTATENHPAAEPASPDDKPAPRQRKGVSVRRIPQQARSQQTVQAVLQAANEEIRRAGLDHLSTKRIAAAAGLSVGSLYGYFPNKESIIAALLEAWLNRVFEAVDSVHPRHGGNRDFFTYLSEQMERARVVYEDQPGIGALFGMVMAIPALHEMVFRHGERTGESMESALKADRSLVTTGLDHRLVLHRLVAEITAAAKRR
ncbi:MAG: TetR/AcrR family transcriptional regulator [Alphaproteobacteria bacterium]|nr:MAG: TetR/AcrR family transcriptional regulator [Alphaproteobacteria bacterium]